MNIFLVTSSARGHAIAAALKRSRHQSHLTVLSATDNPGIAAIADEQHVVSCTDFDAIEAVARQKKYDFAFIGPDDPIGLGLADRLEALGIPTVAPLKSLARIEASKSFTRDLFIKYGIDASPAYRVFTSESASEIASFIDELGGQYVVKYDALKGGKGVKVSGEHLESPTDGIAYANECIAECGRVVIEEKLIGVEFSLLSFVSGKVCVDMPAVQDHKRAFNGDTGPNTGGMGTYSDSNHSLPFLTPADISTASSITKRTADALLQECGQPYKGILYGGFIATKNGVMVIEYNARFGDPEALNILPLLTSDLVDICLGILNESLSREQVSFAHQATVCKYITPASYPIAKDERSQAVTFPPPPPGVEVFYGDVSQQNGHITLGGSRSAGIVGIADTISEAEKLAESYCQSVIGPIRFRSDIGTDDLIKQRVVMMEELRN